MDISTNSAPADLLHPLPTGSTFSETDWRALAPHWYPVEFSARLTTGPRSVRLLDEKLVIWRSQDGTPVAARDLCLHRGTPLSYIKVLPDSVSLKSSAGRQLEGFLDVSHFAFVHEGTFGERNNTVVPNYPVELTRHGFRADYLSTVPNYGKDFKHLSPPGFQWRRPFEVWFPFTAKLTVFFPNDGKLHILNAASPISAKESRVFVPICRNFDKEAPLEATLEFNHQVFAEDKEVVESQCPEELPIDLSQEIHIRADKSSIAYRQGLAKLGLGRSYTS
jgi:phenylpropionate dioxygenase-like ring-hydroxylating dioxygenase large terminal subunit